MSKPRAYTVEEVRTMIIDHIRAMADYWATCSSREGPHTVKERLDGLGFSICLMLDGSTIGLPAFDLVARPHPDDKDYHKSEGENWFKPGMVINTGLHDYYHEREKAERRAKEHSSDDKSE